MQPLRILWLCNIKLPIIAEMQKQEPSPFGGWLDQLSRALIKQNHELHILYPNAVKENGTKGTLRFTSFFEEKSDIEFRKVIDDFMPDVIHIWGTEYLHSRVMTEVLAANSLAHRAVISIQGLVSICAQHYFSGLPIMVIYGFTIRDLIKLDNIYLARNRFRKRGEDEKKALSNVSHIIGRTDWDRACAYHINPKAEYHFCNETLRESFYHNQWNITRCERHSIFISQGSYPIKGLHFMLRALPILLQEYPNTRLYIAGSDPTKSKGSIKEKLKRTSYGQYLLRLIKKHNLSEHVIFTGPLDEKQMCEQYLKSHVFVSSSTIENESNSVSEAKVLGMPVVASYVGGVTSRVRHGVDGLTYQHDAPYMLAHYVSWVFADDDLAVKLGKNARDSGMFTHDAEKNLQRLVMIYCSICK